MLKRQRKIVSVAVVFSLVVALGAGLAGKPAGAATDYGISNPVTDSNGVTTWDKVKFGSYYQTAEFKEPEPIKWRVLSVDGDDAFLLADENLDYKPYNTEQEEVTWETCSLRKWLNEDFYNEAFIDSEKAAIMETQVVNKDNSEYGTAGNDTTDRIYLLSLDEVINETYGFVSKSARMSKSTDYVKFKCNHAWSSSERNGVWWLRSPGDFRNNVSIVYDTGSVSRDDPSVYYINEAVRPALHLNLSSSVYTDAGEVDSEGNVTDKADGIHAPVTDSDGLTTWDCVYLGKYKQKAEWKKEPIEWRVLSADGNDVFLLADKNLDCKPYNTKSERVTWETCSLRKWLNEDFYNEAFSDSEQAAIMETKVVNAFGTAGNDTTDRIYLLSLDEAENADYGFVSGSARESKNTDYVKCKSVYISLEGKGNWLLRSPGGALTPGPLTPGIGIGTGIYSYYASSVASDGDVTQTAYSVTDSNIAVRPVLHLDLSSTSWSKSGQVSSDGNEVPVPSESPSAGESAKPGATPDETGTMPPQASDQSQATNAPQKTNTPSVTADPVPTSPDESPSMGESPKPGGTPGQTETTPSPIGSPSLSSNPPQAANAPQATNVPTVTAAPVSTANAADTGKPGKVSIRSAKNSKKSAVVVTWKKVSGASSYQIQYALDQKFTKGSKTKTTAGTSYTLKKLKKKKTYYVRVRALKKAGSKNVYGAWSKAKKVKIKK